MSDLTGPAPTCHPDQVDDASPGGMLDLAYRLSRPLLFSLGADRAHELMLRTLSFAPWFWGALAAARPDESLQREAFGLPFAGPVGLAAGLDKDGVAIPFWGKIGFGFVEIGTVTAHAQPGNEKPRLFRVVEDGALVNRAGFNNAGSAALAERLRRLRDRGAWPDVPVGVNVGKSKVTPLEDASADYATSLERLCGLADYFTVNVSSPNTPGLRELQERSALEELLPVCVGAAGGTPVLLKLAPDLEDEAIAEAVELSLEAGIAGIVATNTTLSREGLSRDPHEAGGMSGRPLWPLARRKIGVVLEAAAGRLPVIGVGGIHTALQVRELLDAGCVAVQLYTALVFEGPGLPARIHRDLSRSGQEQIRKP